MRRSATGLCLWLFVSTGAQGGWNPLADDKQGDDVRGAAETIAAFRAKDPGMAVFFDKARGFAVFPNVGKAAIGIGGAYGEGEVYERGRLIGYSKLTQLTIGFQLGGQAYSEIVFFKDKATLEDFKRGKLQFSAQASAVAVTAGAAANADYSDGVAIFTLTRGGLMYEASVGGQKFSFSAVK